MKTMAGFVAVLLSATCLAQSQAPAVINAAGGTARSGYFQFEWSIGELSLVNQMSKGELTVTNGFLQPYTLYPVAINPNNYFGNEEVKVFPSPASSYVEINFFTKQKGTILLTFYDAAGKTVFMKGLEGNGVDIVERIPVNHFSGGMYALKIELSASTGYISKTGIYKITKIN